VYLALYVDGSSFDIKCIIKNVENWKKILKTLLSSVG